FSLERAEELRNPVRAQPPGVAWRVRVLKLRVVVDPVEAKGLSGVLLVGERDRLTVDGPVVALDNEVLARAAAGELRLVVGEPDFGGEGMPVVLARKPIGASVQPRLEDVGGVRAAAGQVPLSAEPGKQQLRLEASQHRPALIVGTKVTVGRGPSQTGDDLTVPDQLITRLGPPCRLRVTDGHGAGDRAAE